MLRDPSSMAATAAVGLCTRVARDSQDTLPEQQQQATAMAATVAAGAVAAAAQHRAYAGHDWATSTA